MQRPKKRRAVPEAENEAAGGDHDVQTNRAAEPNGGTRGVRRGGERGARGRAWGTGSAPGPGAGRLPGWAVDAGLRAQRCGSWENTGRVSPVERQRLLKQKTKNNTPREKIVKFDLGKKT